MTGNTSLNELLLCSMPLSFPQVPLSGWNSFVSRPRFPGCTVLSGELLRTSTRTGRSNSRSKLMEKAMSVAKGWPFGTPRTEPSMVPSLAARTSGQVWESSWTRAIQPIRYLQHHFVSLQQQTRIEEKGVLATHTQEQSTTTPHEHNNPKPKE